MKKSDRDDNVSKNQRSFEVFVFFVIPFTVIGVFVMLGISAILDMVTK